MISVFRQSMKTKLLASVKPPDELHLSDTSAPSDGPHNEVESPDIDPGGRGRLLKRDFLPMIFREPGSGARGIAAGSSAQPAAVEAVAIP
jgi:hypothetical protein